MTSFSVYERFMKRYEAEHPVLTTTFAVDAFVSYMAHVGHVVELEFCPAASVAYHAAYYPDFGDITYTTPDTTWHVILHEYAHAVRDYLAMPGDPVSTNDDEDHDKTFVAIMVHIVNDFVEWAA